MKGLFATVVMATAMFCAGSAFATIRSFSAPAMTVAQVVPMPAQAGISVATGTCTATFDDETGQVSFSGTFANLNAPATGAHLHGDAPPGAQAPVILPATTFTAGVSGTFTGAPRVLAPELLLAMANGLTNCTVSDAPNFPAGEIRGQLVAAQAVPAVPGWALVLLTVFLAAGGTYWGQKAGLKRGNALRA